MQLLTGVVALSLAIPAVLHAQYVGLSAGRAVSTVDWQYPAPPVDCDFCAVDASPSASRQSSTPALLVQWRTRH